MSKYFISIFLLVSGIAFSQKSASINDTVVVHKEKYGLRVGADLSKLLRTGLDDNYKGLELVGDIRVSKKIFIAAELGTEEKTTEEDNFTFSTKGTYLKAGFDYNLYENWYGMQNLIHAGMRVGIGTFTQTLESYRIYNTNQGWNESGIPGENLLGEYDGLSAQWAEFVLGIKAELFANIYLSASVRLNYLVNDKAANEFPNLYIPGFNKVTDGSSFGVGYNYTLTYMIPIIKKNKQNRKKDEDKEKDAPKN